MNPRTTIALAFLAALVTAVAWRDASHTELHFQRDLDQPHRFPDASVVGLRVVRPGFEVHLERDDRGWRIVSPVDYPASPVSVEAIVRRVRELRVRGEGPEAAADAGIVESSTRLHLDVRGWGPIDLAFGSPHPTLPYRYAALGEEVVLIDPSIADLVEAVTVDDLRSEALCDIPLPLADSLAVELGEERYAVDRAGEDAWRLVSPSSGDAEGREVRRALESLNAWAAHGFVADAVTDEGALSAYGLSPPAGRIEVRERGTGRTVRLRIGSRTPLPESGGEGLYVFVESTRTVVRATAAILGSLPATEALRSRLLVRIPEPDIVAVRIIGDYRRVDLARTEEGEWSLRWAGDSNPYPADSAFVERMLETLRGSAVERFVPFDDRNLQAQGFDRPILELELLRAGGGREALVVGDEAPGEPQWRIVRNPRWQEAAIAALPDLESWRRAPFSLRSPRAIEIPPEAIRRLRISAESGASRRFVRPNEEWRPEGEESAQPLSAELRAALAALPELRADPWIASAVAPPGPRASRFRIELLPADGSDPEPWLRLWVGPQEEEGRVVRVGDEGWLMRIRGRPDSDPLTVLERVLARP